MRNMFRDPFRGIGVDMEELNQVMGRVPMPYNYYHFKPPSITINVFNTGRTVMVTLDIPGMKDEKDVKVVVADNVVYVEGKTEKYYRGFSRVIPLPVEVDEGKVKTQYKDGIFTVQISKKLY